MNKAIIKGKVVRFAKSENGVIDLSLLVFETHFEGNTFTLGTVICCQIPPKQVSTGDYILKKGSDIPAIDCLKDTEPHTSACSLAVDDRVTIEFRKSKDGTWMATHVKREPAGYQDINEFLSALEENLHKKRVAI